MYIHEAVNKALQEHKFITLPMFKGKHKIKPCTDTPCEFSFEDRSSMVYTPSAKDLTSDKWIVVD